MYAAYPLGKTKEEWKQFPLRSWSGISFSTDKFEYVRGTKQSYEFFFKKYISICLVVYISPASQERPRASTSSIHSRTLARCSYGATPIRKLVIN